MLTELMLTYLSTPTYTVPSSVKFNIKEIAQSLPFVSARNMLRVTLQFDGHLPGLSIINISGLIDSNTPTASGKSQWLNECVRVLFSDLLIFKIAHNYLSTLTFEQSMHVCACINLIWLSVFLYMELEAFILLLRYSLFKTNSIHLKLHFNSHLR